MVLHLHCWRMPSHHLDDNPFSFEFLAEFLAVFDFGGFVPAFGLLFSFGSYEHEFNDASFLFSVGSYVGFGSHCHCRHKKRRPNRQYCRRSVKKSCWYRGFLRPGMTRDLTHELATSNRFGKFCNWFRMPLSKGEELTDVCINRGYLRHARSLLWRSEFRKQSEIFIITALYRLGTGASFWTCRAVSNISVSKICSFFDTFLHVIHEMREDYISMPRNISQLRRITNYYKVAGLPGCCRSMYVVHVKWSSCPTGNHTRAKSKGGYPSLAFQCVTDFNHRILAVSFSLGADFNF